MIVRIGNDFVFLWSIERNGKPENLNECLEIRLFLKASGVEKEIDFEIVNDNIIRIEVTPEMTSVIGIYSLVLRYTLADESFSDNDRKCAVDTKAFTIVANTAMADDISEIAVTSDMLIGLKGDAFTYDDFTEEQLADLRQPAIDAGLIAEQQGNIAEQQGNTAESKGNTAEAKGIYALEQGNYAKSQGELAETVIATEETRVVAEQSRVTAETNRVSAEQNRVNAESDRVTAESNRVSAESDRAIADLAREELYSQTATLKTETETAKDNAITATEKSENISSHPNKIINDYWYKWNYQTQEYENMGERANGVDGESIVNTNPQSTMTQARIWVGTRNEFDNQEPLPTDVITFII